MDLQPKKSRQDIMTEIAQERAAAEHSLLHDVETLEDEYGLTYEQLVDLYGEGVLDIANDRSKNVQKWLTLCELLRTTDKAMIAIVGLRPNYPNHACEPALITPRVDSAVCTFIISDPRSAFIEMTQSGPSIYAFINAEGYRLIQRPGLRAVQPTFDNLAQPPQPLREEIVVGTKYPNFVDTQLVDNMDMIIAGDSFDEIHQQLVAQYRSREAFSGDDIEFDPVVMRLRNADAHRRRTARASATQSHED